MAGALGLRLGGPRAYGSHRVDGAWRLGVRRGLVEKIFGALSGFSDAPRRRRSAFSQALLC